MKLRERKKMANRYKTIIRYLGMTMLMMTLLSGCGNDSKADIKDFHDSIFGENTYIFTPEDEPEQVQAVLDELYESQESNQFGENRYAVLFMPGEYDPSIQVNMGFYMQAAGLGLSPDDTKIGNLSCLARWLSDDPSNHNATCNFWRSVENIDIGSDTVWAVSQATSMRRVHIEGSLYLHDDYGWASGGFLSDSLVDRMVDSGSQQQWLSRNCNWNVWMGENWNMVFAGIGDNNAPTGIWPSKKYTTIETVDEIQEKPFLTYNEDKGYGIFVPDIKKDSTGISWDKEITGTFVEMKDIYVAKPDADTAETMNKALRKGKHLLLTPGIYNLTEPIVVENENTIVMGMGLATLESGNGNICLKTADRPGIKVCGLLFDAGEQKSETLFEAGYDASEETAEKEVPILLSDLYFRVGGAAEHNTQVENCVTIKSSHVLGDNFWVWRADHGSQVGWELNQAKNGIIIDGDYVTIYALLVEHFQEYQTIWNGDFGKTCFYQCEIPYDVPNQDSWKSHDGSVNGFASYYIADDVTSHEAWGLGIYSFNRDAVVELYSAMEAPECEDVKIHNICTVMITGNPGISHIINGSGKAVMTAGAREVICEFENGEIVR